MSSPWEGLSFTYSAHYSQDALDVTSAFQWFHFLALYSFNLHTKQLGRGRGCSNGDVFQVSSPLVCVSQLEYFHVNLQCSSLDFSFAILLQRQPLLKIYTLLPYPREDFSSRIFIYLAFFSTKVSGFAKKSDFTQWGNISFNLDTCVRGIVFCIMSDVLKFLWSNGFLIHSGVLHSFLQLRQENPPGLTYSEQEAVRAWGILLRLSQI